MDLSHLTWCLTYARLNKWLRFSIKIKIQYFKNMANTWNIEGPQGSLLNKQMTSRDIEFSNLNCTTWQF